MLMRYPAVAGQFYPGDPERLLKTLEKLFSNFEIEEEKVISAVSPHAGYMFSGKVAAAVYSRIPEVSRYVIIGPNHHSTGAPVSASKEQWKTPLGVVEVDGEFVDALFDEAVVDERAHLREHSIEVQIPFLQYRFKDFKIVPLCMSLQDELTSAELGKKLAEVTKEFGDTVIIASSDFSHYVPYDRAYEDDSYVIDAILRLDVDEMYRRIFERGVTVCGYGPIAAAIHSSKLLGAERGKKVAYMTSGDVIGDRSSVVGYAGILIE
ncbi:MAG: MEMO1 family protein [Archaeoglobi archaeon]|nr:MEMO1 family protein [Candidatus Mnemosynella bozhongmuii]